MPFDRMLILEYLEGCLPDEKMSDVEKHIQSHPDLLAETLELNRINAVMEAGKPESLPADSFVLVEFAGEIIRHFEGTHFRFQVENMLATRNRSIAGQSLKAETDNVSLEILPSYEGSFWIVLKSPGLKNSYVSLSRPSDDFPIFSRKAGETVTIKGVAPGHYYLSFLHQRFDIMIRESSAD